ncbi:VOC family protein [bacterium]|nr:MAG: VOC family protein [bacterium]
MIGLRGVHHVAIIVSDYERSKRFYTEVLGAEIVSEVFRPERQSHKLDLCLPGGVQIEMFDFSEAPARPTRPEAQGLRHLALTVDDLDVALEHVRAKAVEHEDVRVDPLNGNRFVFFADPDGLPIELVELTDRQSA